MDRENEQYFDCLCRTCMNEVVETDFSIEQQCQSIYDRIEECGSLPIAELLSKAMPQLEVKQSDALPKKICRECVQQLINVYRFQQMCLHSDRQMRELIVKKYAVFKKPVPETLVECEINIEQGIEVDCFNILSEAPPTNDNDPLQSNCIKNEPCDYNRFDDECSDHDTCLPTINVKNEMILSVTTEEKQLKLEQNKKLDTQKDALSVDKLSFECEFCNRRFSKPESLHKHRLKHENNEDKSPCSYACNLCQKAYKSRIALSRHRRMEHFEKTLQKPPRKYPCEICSKSYTSKGALTNHIRSHTGERPYLCPECGKAFTAAGNMEQHRLRHSDIKAFECPYCPLKFHCKSDVANHKVIHSGTKPHICDICGEGFCKPYELKKHKLNHSGIKPYKCEHCEMHFVRLYHQRRHMLTHTGEKPYKCKFCERAFAQSNDHVKHLRTHLGDNVYGCSLCPAGFRLASELRLHFATHKNDDEETRDRNMKALKDKEAKLQQKLFKNEIQAPLVEDLERHMEAKYN